MTLKLKKPEIYFYRKGDHLSFHEHAYALCEKYEAQIASPSELETYQDAVATESAVFNWLQRSEYTAKKAATDSQRDAVWKNIGQLLRIYKRHFDPSKRDAAVRLYMLFAHYGDLAHADYDAETVKIEGFVVLARSSDYAPAVAALALGEWIEELGRLNDAFKGVADAVLQEQSDKPATSLAEARRTADLALRTITVRIGSLITLNGPEGWSGFVDEFNALVVHFNVLLHEHYGRLHARIDIAGAHVATIEPQTFTGQPVYVIPDVAVVVVQNHVEQIEPLTFTKDFTVTYKDNVDPGTATIFIKGVGRYVGQLIVTFNIVARPLRNG
ncbi:MAG: DUF6261 family protein [Prevotellaceae bacterium]|jgi:hypothetical protein|nr:DUF6261 family protein [Prevotellaceae bacterium]